MGLKKIFKSKKGIAIETAILSIIVIFSLCFLVTSLTLVGHYQVQIESAFILNDAKLDQIGEDFIHSPQDFKVDGYKNQGFSCRVTDGKKLEAWYKNDKNQIIILEVELDGSGKVITWRKNKR